MVRFKLCRRCREMYSDTHTQKAPLVWIQYMALIDAIPLALVDCVLRISCAIKRQSIHDHIHM